MTKAEFYRQGVVKINEVYQIFKDYYTEERVDLRNVISEADFLRYGNAESSEYYSLEDEKSPYILVHFPSVTITNEHNDSVFVKDLWAKMYLTYKGTLKHGFLLNRSHYFRSHWDSDYMHSHIAGIPKDHITHFQPPCLGRGPIRDTVHSLIVDYDEMLWQLFCRELEVYVGVESLEGIPYRRMQYIGSNNRNLLLSSYGNNLKFEYNQNTISLDYIKKFVKYVVDSKKLKFCFDGISYSIAMHWMDYYITISNLFIEWYNDMYNKGEIRISYDSLISRNIINKADVAENKIYFSKVHNRPNRASEGSTVLIFKDKEIKLVIEDDSTNDNIPSHILNISIATSILRSMLTIINYKYGRNKETVAPSGTKFRVLL